MHDTEVDYDDFDGNTEYGETVFEKANAVIGEESEVSNHEEMSSTAVHNENESAIGMILVINFGMFSFIENFSNYQLILHQIYFTVHRQHRHG